MARSLQALALLAAWLARAAAAVRSFAIAEDAFWLDGAKIQIRSGSVHYFRIPREYWQDRLLRARAMGLNAVQFYVPWNWHEEVEGRLNWEGDRDLAAFIKLTQSLGLLVLLRAGPYVCGEWEFGGFPAWLLQYVDRVRTYDDAYIAQVDKWWSELLPRVKPLLYSNGGPVVMVQIENEFGSFGRVDTNPLDKRYMEHLLAAARAHLGPEALLYTTDGGAEAFMRRGSLPGGDVLTLGDGRWNCRDQSKLNPVGRSPCMNNEQYPGWLTHWGEAMANSSTSDYGLEAALDAGYSFNLYMAHGGTNFGWMSGANGGGKQYQATITSYDYGAPIAEDGSHGFGREGRDKFLALQRAMLSRAPAGGFPAEPPPLPRAAYGAVRFARWAPLLTASVLQAVAPRRAVQLPGAGLGYMERALKQNYGFVLYSAEAAAEGDVLEISEYPRDRAQVFLGSEYQGAIFRPEAAPLRLKRPAAKGEALSLLVENMGRLNFGRQMYDPKGLGPDAKVTLSGSAAARNWSALGLSLENASLAKLELQPSPADCSSFQGPAFYRGSLRVEGSPADTFLRFDGFTKGLAWVNGVGLGRYWKRPPQRALYVPAPFLRQGQNDVLLLELDSAPANCSAAFSDKQDFSGRPAALNGEEGGASLLVV